MVPGTRNSTPQVANHSDGTLSESAGHYFLLSVLMASLMSWNWWRVLFLKACSSSLLSSVRWMSSAKRSLLIFYGLSPMNKTCSCSVLEGGMSLHLTGGDQLSLLSHPWIYVEFRFFLLICDVCCAVRQHRRQSASLTDSLSLREAARPLFHEAEQNWRTVWMIHTKLFLSLTHTQCDFPSYEYFP